MTIFKWSILLIIPFLFINCTKQKELSLRVLQFNIWQEGTIVPNGYSAILDEVINAKADLIALSEVRNYKQKSLAKRLVRDLKERGFTFYSDSSQDSGILSKYPIVKQEAFYPVIDDRGSVTKAVIKIGDKEVAFYSAHLDYRNCAIYLPRGYDGSTWKPLDAPITDINLLLADNLKSKRIEAIKNVIADAKLEEELGRIVLLAGDFNEASHRDWIKENKDLYEHNGVVIPWTSTTMLEEDNFIDAYREIYPNPITHPGFTFPCYNVDLPVERVVWAPKSDERDRIDFIFYKPNSSISLKDIFIIGPKQSVAYSKVIDETSEDVFQTPLGVWPTDHKAVLGEFILKL